MFEDNKEGEAILYYLYMMADGEISPGEKKIFGTICKELDISADDRKAIIARCGELTEGKNNIFSVIVKEKIDEQAGENWGTLRDASDLARIIWNLVNLGYADSVYSEEEKKITDYLADKWSVSAEVHREFLDTADTIAALVKHKKWILSTLPEGEMRKKREKKVNSDIKKLSADVKLTIEEHAM